MEIQVDNVHEINCHTLAEAVSPRARIRFANHGDGRGTVLILIPRLEGDDLTDLQVDVDSHRTRQADQRARIVHEARTETEVLVGAALPTRDLLRYVDWRHRSHVIGSVAADLIDAVLDWQDFVWSRYRENKVAILAGNTPPHDMSATPAPPHTFTEIRKAVEELE